MGMGMNSVHVSIASRELSDELTYLELLPLELLERILLLVASDLTDCIEKATLSLCCASRVSRRMHEGSQCCWQCLTRALVGPAHALPVAGWLGDVPRHPHGWRECVAGACTLRSLQLCHLGAPLPRPKFGHSVCAWKGRLFLFGGRYDLEHYEDLKVLDLQTRSWSTPATQGPNPSRRRFHSATVDPGTEWMHIVGGGCGTIGIGDMHALNLETLEWLELSPPPGFRHLSHSCVRVPASIIPGSSDACLLVYGGVTMAQAPAALQLFGVQEIPEASSQLLSYRLHEGRWVVMMPDGEAPLGRYRHAAIYLDSGTMVVSGGTVVTQREGRRPHSRQDNGHALPILSSPSFLSPCPAPHTPFPTPLTILCP